MNALITELKTRARIGLNAIHAGDFALVARAEAVSGKPRAHPPEWKLRHCLGLVANAVGFADWDEGRRVLGGTAGAGDDMGTFWHAPRCNGLLSHWFARYDEARTSLAVAADRTLLPYRRQFVVVGEPYLRELGLDPGDPHRHGAGRDLVAGYGGPDWLALAERRLRAPLETWAKPPI